MAVTYVKLTIQSSSAQISNISEQQTPFFNQVVLISLLNNEVYNDFSPNVLILKYSALGMLFLLYFKILPHVNSFRNGKAT